MLLAIDVGNTNTVLGVYEGRTLRAHWRIETTARRTFDEYGILTLQLFAHANLDPRKVEAVVVSSVVPSLQFNLEKMSERYFGTKPMFVGPGVKTGRPSLYDNPREVGADRIVNAVAAWERHKGALIVVDFGTATTFDAVTARGEYAGGAITPGITIAMDALTRNASKLPPGGIHSAAPRDRQEHRALDAVGPGVRLRLAGRWHLRSNEEGPGAHHQGDRHRGPGALDRLGVEGHRRGR